MEIILPSAVKISLAGFITSWSIAQLTTQSGTFVMAAFPLTFHVTRDTQLATCLITMVMYATIFTLGGAWWTFSAGRLTVMRTNQHAPALLLTPLMYATHSTFATRARATVTTFQGYITANCAV